jgi:hypothetical protein
VVGEFVLSRILGKRIQERIIEAERNNAMEI